MVGAHLRFSMPMRDGMEIEAAQSWFGIINRPSVRTLPAAISPRASPLFISPQPGSTSYFPKSSVQKAEKGPGMREESGENPQTSERLSTESQDVLSNKRRTWTRQPSFSEASADEGKMRQDLASDTPVPWDNGFHVSGHNTDGFPITSVEYIYLSAIEENELNACKHLSKLTSNEVPPSDVLCTVV